MPLYQTQNYAALGMNAQGSAASTAAGPAAGRLQDGDLVLIKGSRTVRLEVVLDAVLAAASGGRPA